MAAGLAAGRFFGAAAVATGGYLRAAITAASTSADGAAKKSRPSPPRDGPLDRSGSCMTMVLLALSIQVCEASTDFCWGASWGAAGGDFAPPAQASERTSLYPRGRGRTSLSRAPGWAGMELALASRPPPARAGAASAPPARATKSPPRPYRWNPAKQAITRIANLEVALSQITGGREKVEFPQKLDVLLYFPSMLFLGGLGGRNVRS